MQQQPADIEVIQLVLQGQQNAFATLVERYRAYVFTLVLRYVPDRELAEELAQDVFVKAYRSLANFKGDSKFSTWLYTIVNTTCLSQLRKKTAATFFPGDEQMINLSGNEGAHVTEYKAKKELVAKAIGALPQEDARVITLFYMAEQSVEEIGVILDITEANVKVRLYRARQKLKIILETTFMNELN
jgi:RNA polymerase sigma factor (sigma-70 family)